MSGHYFDRADFAAIAQWIEPSARVLDLGCGDGSLLTYLKEKRNIQGWGVELRPEGVLASLRQGVNVIQSNLEAGLSGFRDNMFDRVILSQTLQAVHHTEEIVAEMLRVGREAIVTFPNFGYWHHRLEIFYGRMPVSRELPYQWYNTPNIHLCTIADFEIFCQQRGYDIMNSLVLHHGRQIKWLPNLRGSLAVFRIRKA